MAYLYVTTCLCSHIPDSKHSPAPCFHLDGQPGHVPRCGCMRPRPLCRKATYRVGDGARSQTENPENPQLHTVHNYGSAEDHLRTVGSRQDWTKPTTFKRLADVFHSVRSSLQNFKKCRRLGTTPLPWGLVCLRERRADGAPT